MAKKTETPKASALEPAMHPLQNFVAKTVLRSQIAKVEYNPRQISEKGQRALKGGLQKLGLLDPLIWNERNGCLVGGHQRITLLDGLADGAADYKLTVAAVNLTDAEEREANILLNNPEAQGEWDISKLTELFKTEGLRIEATGFDMADVYRLVGTSPFEEREDGASGLAAISKQLHDAAERVETVINERSASRDAEDFYLVLVFRDGGHCSEFLTALNLEDNRYQDGRTILRMVKGEPEEDDTGDAVRPGTLAQVFADEADALEAEADA